MRGVKAKAIRNLAKMTASNKGIEVKPISVDDYEKITVKVIQVPKVFDENGVTTIRNEPFESKTFYAPKNSYRRIYNAAKSYIKRTYKNGRFNVAKAA